MTLESQPKITLTVIKGPEPGKLFEFTEQDNFLLGRDAPGSHAHFRLSQEDRTVSRNHFLLEINPPDCHLRDAGSLNGTFIVRRSGETGVSFLEGRQEMEWTGMAKYLARSFQCQSYRKVEEKIIKLEDGDLISVGDTLLEVKIIQTAKEVQQEEAFNCIHCGKDITNEVIEKRAEKLTAIDFICEECRKKQPEKPAPEGDILCWGCNKDLTPLANSDGRAEELKEIAFYWCESCTSSRQEKVPISRIANYRILKELGAGGFGVVYLAWQETTGRIVALKLTKERIKKNEDLLRRFKREKAIMQKLRHPHLVRLYDGGVSEEENYYFVSEYLSEGSLADHFNANYKGKMPYKVACYFITQALEGLSYFHTHEEKYVHRDLKPENIFLRKNDKGEFIAKVGDFGLARSYILHGGTITKAGEWAGTILYCPPEQITDFKNAKPYSDVYAMGMSLYFLITGEFPYDFPTRKKYLEMISRGIKPRDPVDIILSADKPIPIEKKVTDIPKSLAKAINKAIEKDASKRFISSEEFRKAIKEYSI